MSGGVDWRRVYSVATGATPGQDEFVPPYVASLIFFTINVTAGIVLRALSSVFLPSSIRSLAIDFLCTMEACAYFFENNFVLKYYGSLWFGIAIVIQCFICARTWGDANENPVKAFQAFLSGQTPFLKAVIQIVVQTLAGLASYRFAKLVWSLDLIEDHHERFYETSCGSDLQVALIMGFAIELSASLMDSWLNMQTVSATPLLDELIKYANAALMIVIGVTTTGMYFNPAMASGHTLGCKGTAFWEHFVVYWIGPFIGGAVALKINQMVHLDVTQKAPAKVAKKGEGEETKKSK